MPKVVSRSAVSTSADADRIIGHRIKGLFEDCICGEFILVIDKHLGILPKRQTDGATIVRVLDDEHGKARVWKLNAAAKLNDPIIVERQDGYERQWRYSCPRCSLPVCYQCSPPPATSAPFLYFLKGSLTQIQGQVPPDAFDGDNEATP